MCGMFGTVRPHRYPQHLRGVAASAMLDLGYLAEERGTDSAGLATLHRRALTDHPSAADPTVRETTTGHWRIVTALGPFTDRLPDRPRLRSNLQTARIVLGHTRRATQGTVNLSNASPMLVDDVIGTHNGDVTAPCVDSVTDSAWLFSQLGRATSVKATVAFLTGIRGRAALVWARRSRPDLLFLGRAALSPL
jgi:glutamine phosphoribosylpyrophosphate amidotransferase